MLVFEDSPDVADRHSIGPLRLVRPCFTGSDRVNLAELVAPLAADTAALAA
jgi:hypothetical protein